LKAPLNYNQSTNRETLIRSHMGSVECQCTFCSASFVWLTKFFCLVLLGLWFHPFPQIDIIRAMVIVWRVRGKIMRSVMQYCVQQLCTVQCTHMNRPNSSVDWVCLTGPISLCLDSFLWSPYVIGQTIIFSSCFFLLSFFFPRLISAVGDWMFTILWHMVWP